MITEDYVSFETAKLLKEKGFYQDFYNSFIPVWHYNGNNKVLSFTEDDSYPSETQEWYSAPTLQMAMKWLREVHNLALNVCYLLGMWSYSVYRIDVNSSGFNSEDFDTYEEACEAGIRYCLENLI